jgi:GST-like protein
MMVRRDNQREKRTAMELYAAGTGNGQRAAVAVNECGLARTMHVLNLAQGDQKTPDYLKINPTARIPTLIDPDGPGGRELILIQSWAILYYLAEKTGKLILSYPAARARTYQWLGEAATDMAPTAQNIFFLGNRMPEKVPQSAIKLYEDWLVTQFRVADDQLATHPIRRAMTSPLPISASTWSMPGGRR